MCERVRAVTTVVFALLVGACSGDDGSRLPGPGDDGTSRETQSQEGSSSSSSATSDPCTNFDKRDCVIDLGVTDGIHNCAKGVQLCENGKWTTCALLNP